MSTNLNPDIPMSTIENVASAVAKMTPYERNDFFRAVRRYLPMSWECLLQKPTIWWDCDEEFKRLILIIYPQFKSHSAIVIDDQDFVEWLEDYEYRRQ